MKDDTEGTQTPLSIKDGRSCETSGERVTLAEAVRIAASATPGPWRELAPCKVHASGRDFNVAATDYHAVPGLERRANAAHIAACDPANVATWHSEAQAREAAAFRAGVAAMREDAAREAMALDVSEYIPGMKVDRPRHASDIAAAIRALPLPEPEKSDA